MWAKLGLMAKNALKKKALEKATQGESGARNMKILALISGGAIVLIMVMVLGLILVYFSPIIAVANFVSNVFSGITSDATNDYILTSTSRLESYESEMEFKEYLGVIDEKYNGRLDMVLVEATIFYYPEYLDEEFSDSIANACTTNEGDYFDPSVCVQTATDSDTEKQIKAQKSQIAKLAKKLSQGNDIYNEYLLNDYIPANFAYVLNTGKTEEQILEEIYTIAEYYNDVIGKSLEIQSGQSMFANVQVKIMNCAGTLEQDTVSLDQYIIGALYAESDYGSGDLYEYQLTMAVAVRTYVLRKGGYTFANPNNVVTIKNCSKNLNYCDPYLGCDHSSGVTTPGAGSDGKYWKQPMSAEKLAMFTEFISATADQVLVKNGELITPMWLDDWPTCNSAVVASEGGCGKEASRMVQTEAMSQSRSGMTYQEILAYWYDAEIYTAVINLIGGESLGNTGVESILIAPFGIPILNMTRDCVSSGFYRSSGAYHGAVDWGQYSIGYSSDTAVPVVSMVNSTIISMATGLTCNTYPNNASYCGEGWGNYIRVQINDPTSPYHGYRIVYAHLAPNSIPSSLGVGDELQQGQFIGTMGNTGNSSGTHLHIKIWDEKGNDYNFEEAARSYCANLAGG